MAQTCKGGFRALLRSKRKTLQKSRVCQIKRGSMKRPGYEELVVRATTATGATCEAITLRAAPWMRMSRDAPPSPRYKQLIVDGASELGLSDAYIARIADMPVACPSAVLTAVARAHGVFAILLFRAGLRRLLLPLRAACYFLLRPQARGAVGPVRRAIDLGAELATCALLLPTASIGALIRIALGLCGRQDLVQFGPPPRANRTASPAASEAGGAAAAEVKLEAGGRAERSLAQQQALNLRGGFTRSCARPASARVRRVRLHCSTSSGSAAADVHACADVRGAEVVEAAPSHELLASLRRRAAEIELGAGRRFRVVALGPGFLNVHTCAGDPWRTDNVVAQLPDGAVVESTREAHGGAWICHDGGGWSIRAYDGHEFLVPVD